MTTWPNWLDLCVLTTVLRASYKGFHRGCLTELFTLVAAMCITALTINYAGAVSGWLQRAGWVWQTAHLPSWVFFWGFFLTVWLGVHLLLSGLHLVMKWESSAGLVRGMGLVLGLARGLWWSGVFLVVCASSGVPFLQESVEHRSVTGSRFLQISRDSLDYVTSRFPGAAGRRPTLVPPFTGTGDH